MKKRIISFFTSIAIAITVFFGTPGIEAKAAECTMTADEAINWVNQHFTNGQKGGQCLAFVNNYIYALCGKAMNAETAWCISCKWETGSNYDKFGVFNSTNYPFTFIKGNSNMNLQKGDILLYHNTDFSWGNSCFCGLDHYYCGHIAIYESENRWYDSNGNGDEIFRIRTTSPRWSSLYGVLRPNFKKASSTPTGSKEVPAATGYPVNDNVYQIRCNALPGYQLNVYGGTDANGTSVCSWGFDNSIEQRFRFKHVGNGAYRIYAMCSGGGNSRVLDVNVGADNTLNIGDGIDIWSIGGYDNCQLFNMIPIGNGNYIIELASMHNAVIGMTEQGNGKAITLQRYSGSDTQHWFLVDPGVEGIRSSKACTHKFTETVTKAASCKETGTKKKTCAWCSASTTETIAKTGHDYSTAWTTDVKATCTTTGSKSHHCKICGAKKDVTTVPKAAHNYSSAWTIDVKATCTSTGSKSRHCTVCGAKGDVTTVPKAAHNYSSAWTIDVKATCTSTGSKSRHCTVCGAKTDVTTVPKAAHNYSSVWTTDVNATCTATGSKSRHCTVCGAKGDVTTVPKAAHNYSSVWTTDVNATCTSTGSKSRHCTVCGAKGDVTAIAALGHDWNNGVVTANPTDTTTGTRTYTCKTCNTTKTEIIPKLDSSNKPKNVKATSASHQIRLTWNKVSGATGYIVKSADGKTQYTKSSVKSNSYTVKGLRNGTQYKFKVYAYVDGKWFGSSTVSKTPTGAPQNVKATAGSKSVNLSWDKVDGATGYVIKSADGKTQYTGSIKTTSYTVSGLKGGKQYKFKVYAYVDGKWYASATKTKSAKA